MRRRPRRSPRQTVTPVRYDPPKDWRFDVEVKMVSVVGRRASLPLLGVPERADFNLFIHVRAGAPRHVVDFQTLTPRAGSVLTIRAGQVHQFDLRSDWQAALVIFRPELLPGSPAVDQGALSTAFEALPPHLELSAEEDAEVDEQLARMVGDARKAGDAASLSSLLRSQLEALIFRLDVATGRRAPSERGAGAQQRLREFKDAVERHFATQREVWEYAAMLGCSERTLSRLTHDGFGVSAKAFIAQRVVLEAKRLLGHTALPVAEIAEVLGFDEPTNFGKFFRRYVGCSPLAFRDRSRAVR